MSSNKVIKLDRKVVTPSAIREDKRIVNQCGLPYETSYPLNKNPSGLLSPQGNPPTIQSTVGHLLIALGKTLIAIPRELIKEGEEYRVSDAAIPPQIPSSLNYLIKVLNGTIEVTPEEVEDEIVSIMSEEGE